MTIRRWAFFAAFLVTAGGCGASSAPTDASQPDADFADASLDAATHDADFADAIVASCGAGAPSEPGVVVTTSGAVRGRLAEGVWSWLGVPFAEPPERWRPPERRACWEGVYEATDWPGLCRQMSFDSEPGSPETGTPTGQDDCLAVNVWAPATVGPPRPVLVYIHGGGNQQGASSQVQAGVHLFEGDLLAARGDVIVVTLQYRVGPFGFLAHPALVGPDGRAGNLGLLDQIAALEWVRDNIAGFGGDPSRVMLFGESGGALDTCMMLVSPLARGLFSRALMQSGGCLAGMRADREAEALEHAAALGCPDPEDRACLEELSDEAWLSRVEPPFTSGRVSLDWGPTVDGLVLPDDPEAMLARGEHNHVPFVIGSNAEETGFSVPPTVTPETVTRTLSVFPEPQRSQLLALYPPGTTNAEARRALILATTDAQFTCTARRIAALASSSQEEPVYRYFFDHEVDSALGRLFGATHGLELFYVFQTIERSEHAVDGLAPDDAAVAALMLERWTSFARDGTPSGALAWSPYDDTEPSFVISPSPRIERDVRREACEVWDSL